MNFPDCVISGSTVPNTKISYSHLAVPLTVGPTNPGGNPPKTHTREKAVASGPAEQIGKEAEGFVEKAPPPPRREVGDDTRPEPSRAPQTQTPEPPT
jgi:hypothetical protein